MSYFDYRLMLCLFGFTVHLSECFGLYNSELSEEKATFIFHRNIDDVPDHHIVNVETSSKQRNKRNAENIVRLVQFQIDEQKYNLKLIWRRRTVFGLLTPVWMITSVPGHNPNYIYKVVNQEDKIIDGIFFEDSDTMATLLAHYDKNQRRILYDGIFGLGTETHVIRSVPEKWRTIFRPTESFKRLNSKRNNDHIVYRAQTHNKESRSAFLSINDTSDEIDKMEMPIAALHIKILPVVDYELFKLLGENVKETLKYIATFWNAVDMRFSKIDRLKVEITVTGVVIATDEHGLSFIDESRDKTDSTKVNAYELLEAARMYYYENFIKDTGLTNYDAIFVMTALNTKPTAGMSYIGRICNRLYSTALIQDDANFLGLHSAVHELGHLLNFYHDGSDNAEDCDPHPKENVSTVMAPFISRAKSIVWSECSKNSLEEFVKTKAAKCLRETYRIK